VPSLCFSGRAPSPLGSIPCAPCPPDRREAAVAPSRRRNFPCLCPDELALPFFFCLGGRTFTSYMNPTPESRLQPRRNGPWPLCRRSTRLFSPGGPEFRPALGLSRRPGFNPETLLSSHPSQQTAPAIATPALPRGMGPGFQHDPVARTAAENLLDALGRCPRVWLQDHETWFIKTAVSICSVSQMQTAAESRLSQISFFAVVTCSCSSSPSCFICASRGLILGSGSQPAGDRIFPLLFQFRSSKRSRGVRIPSSQGPFLGIEISRLLSSLFSWSSKRIISRLLFFHTDTTAPGRSPILPPAEPFPVGRSGRSLPHGLFASSLRLFHPLQQSPNRWKIAAYKMGGACGTPHPIMFRSSNHG
jgi:hypothetical protein